MDITLFSLSGLFIMVSSGVMAFLMVTLGRTRLHFLWALFCVSVFIWGIGGYLIGGERDIVQAEQWWRLTHLGVAFIPVLFLHFVYAFLNLKRAGTLVMFYALATLFALFTVYSDLLIAHMRFVFGEFYYDSPPGLLYPLFTVYFFAVTIFSHYLLYRNYRTRTVPASVADLNRTRIGYFFLGMLISFSGGSLSFLPVFEIDVYPIANFAVTLYPLIIGYAILRHQLFDLRVAAVQGLTFLLWMFVGVRWLLSEDTKAAWLNGILFISVVVLGVFLVRSMGKEIRTRERIEKLAKELEAANERLKELDQLKSEFVSLATHQIRGPISAIRGYASMLLEGDYGSVPEVWRKPVETILQSSASLAGIVQDFLDVSRIEQGRMKYEFTVFDISKLVQSVGEELAPNIEGKGLRLKLEIEPRIMVYADSGKVRQVIENIIDNAQKYTLQGNIKIGVRKQDDKAIISVSDSGVGIPKETLPHLFKKFSRASDASKANIKGTGLGLYVARQLVEAQGGTIRAASEGEGKGATFVVELPAK